MLAGAGKAAAAPPFSSLEADWRGGTTVYGRVAAAALLAAPADDLARLQLPRAASVLHEVAGGGPAAECNVVRAL